MKYKTFREFEITVDVIKEVKKLGDGSFEFKDQSFLVKVKQGNGDIVFGVAAGKDHGDNLRKVFKLIQEELYL